MTSPVPSAPVLDILRPAYAPCRHFGHCKEARWDPPAGHIPRGYAGATGDPDDVEVIMVFQEPSLPQDGETYPEGLEAEGYAALLGGVVRDSIVEGRMLFHRNIRWFLDQLYPGGDEAVWFRKVWMTEGRLCSFENKLSALNGRLCAETYLTAQIALFRHASVVGFGAKARDYLVRAGIDHLAAYALAPPGANHYPARPSWQAAIDEILARRVARRIDG